MAKKTKSIVINKKTGEVLSKEEARKQIQQEAIDATNKSNEELRNLGLAPNIKTKLLRRGKKEHQAVTVKENHEFNKVFRVALRELMQEQNLSKNARLAIGTLIAFITFPTNIIMVDGDNPSNDKLMELLDLSPVTLKSTLKELERHEVIKRKKGRQPTSYVFQSICDLCRQACG